MKFGLVLLIALVVVVQAKKDLPGRSDEEAKIIRDYEAMNKYLAKRVDTSDVYTTVSEAKRNLNFMPYLKSKSLTKVYKSFVGLADLMEAKKCTPEAEEYFRMNDIGADDSHLESNHKLRPIDRVIQHYGYKYVSLCDKESKLQTRFTFKENHYQEMNEMLSEATDKKLDIDKDRLVVRNLFEKYLLEDPRGAMTETFENLIDLRLLIDPEFCNYDRGYEIILRNKIGSRFLKNGKVIAFVDHYAQEHSKMCSEDYPSKFESMMRELDSSLFKSLVTISGSFFTDRHVFGYLDTSSRGYYDEFKNYLLDSANLKALNENRQSNYLTTENAELKGSDFYRILKDLSKKQTIDSDRIPDLFNSNLREPCKVFMRKAGELYKRVNYAIKNLGGLYGNNEEEFKSWVGVYFFTPAFRACRQVDYSPDETINMISGAMQP